MIKTKDTNKTKDLGFEIRRQTMHILIGLFILFLAMFNREFALWLLFLSVIFGICLSFLQVKFRFRFITMILNGFEREEYKERFPFRGIIFILAGCLLVLKLFTIDIALASIAILTFSDSVSHVIGMLGRQKSPLDASKNLEGTVFGIIMGTIAASFFVSLFFAFTAAFFAAVAETLSFKFQEEKVDDNLIVPLVAGTVMFLLGKFL